MQTTLEKALAFHCAPALAGMKAGNLLCGHEIGSAAYRQEIDRLNGALNGRDMYFYPICMEHRPGMLLVYRKKRLKEQLKTPGRQAFLQNLGYPMQRPLEEILAHLTLRMQQEEGFPHEIGLFLGYPLEDVEGFCTHQGKHYKHNGYWKVYGNEQETAALFERFTFCRQAVCHRVNAGMSITQLFGAAY